MTDHSLEELNQLKNKALQELAQIADPIELERWRVRYLGRKGLVPQLLREIKNLTAAEKKEQGSAGNALRDKLEEEFIKRNAVFSASLSGNEPLGTEALGGVPPSPGHLHPLTLTTQRIQSIFAALGFLIVEGPEVEETKFNFDALNIPLEHPARAETDTFYIENAPDLVLRTHVSPLQSRAVFEHKLMPPFKFMYSGRCFRAEKVDATHESTFHQFEFMVVSETANLAELKALIKTIYSTFFQKEVNIRLRPSFFPFVEPGLEVDISCVFCGGKGCTVCKRTGWIELAGAGMVHPNVLRNINVDPAKYQGFAMGAAIDRLAMLLHGITDIRLFWSGDMRFLKQFS